MSKKREVKRVELKGLNYVGTVHNIEDGFCNLLVNMSRREGVWRNVNEHTLHSSFVRDDCKIVFQHSVLPDNQYIAIISRIICQVAIVNREVELIDEIFFIEPETDAASFTFDSFEDNMIMRFSDLDGSSYQSTLIYRNGRYQSEVVTMEYSIPEPKITYDYYTPPLEASDHPAIRVGSVVVDTDGTYNGAYTVKSFDKRYESLYADFAHRNYIHGAVYLMFAVKMNDGSVICNSKIYMLDCEKGAANDRNSFYRYEHYINYENLSYYKNIHGFIPTISFDNLINLERNDAVKSIVVYSTRNTPIYDFTNLFFDFPRDNKEYVIEWLNTNMYMVASSKHIIDKRNVDVANTPFYAIAELDFRKTKKITLGYRQYYQDIEQRPIFNPTISPHRRQSAGSISFNGRFHQYNMKFNLYGGASQYMGAAEVIIKGAKYHRVQSDSAYRLHSLCHTVTVRVLGKELYVNTNFNSYYYKKVISESGTGLNITYTYDTNEYIIIPNALSYPDVRATNIDLFFIYKDVSNTNRYKLIKSYKLTASLANNLAVSIDTYSDSMFFYEIFVLSSLKTKEDYSVKTQNRVFTSENMLMVSEPNNPNVYYPKHIYYIGEPLDTQITDINMPTDQLSENRFGQYPLYVFTTKGIYAIEQGSDDLLYQNVVKISSDIIEAKSKTITAMGSTFYYTVSGLMCLSGLVSKPISDRLGDVRLFMSGAVMVFLPHYKELMIINYSYRYAFIYMFNSGEWSTRNFQGRLISMNKYISGSSIYKLLDGEGSKTLPIQISFREMNFGTTFLKKIDVFKVELLFTEGVKIRINGSNDLENWYKLNAVEDKPSIRRCRYSWRWYDIRIEAESIVINDLLFEYYIKYAKHIK